MDELTPDTPEVRALLEKAQAGDRKAFDDLFARFRDHLHQFIQRRLDPSLRSRLDVSDVVQETQLDVFRRLADFLQRRPMPFHLWLRKTAYERLLMLRRQHVEAARRSVFREAALPDGSSLYLAQCLAQTGSTPSQQLSRRERARRVQQAVATLSEADQEVLLMRNFENLSYQEVACLLDIDPAAARKRHGRALLRLHQALAACGVTESQL
jgi:RNA polymerase sigma-70 factor (ECF subfamily)